MNWLQTVPSQTSSYLKGEAIYRHHINTLIFLNSLVGFVLSCHAKSIPPDEIKQQLQGKEFRYLKPGTISDI